MKRPRFILLLLSKANEHCCCVKQFCYNQFLFYGSNYKWNMCTHDESFSYHFCYTMMVCHDHQKQHLHIKKINHLIQFSGLPSDIVLQTSLTFIWFTFSITFVIILIVHICAKIMLFDNFETLYKNQMNSPLVIASF